MPRPIAFTLIVLTAVSCTEPVVPAGVLFEGTITERDPGPDLTPGMLVESSPGSPPDSLCTNGSFYWFRPAMRVMTDQGSTTSFDALVVGARVRVSSSGVRLDSCFPQTGADSVLILPPE